MKDFIEYDNHNGIILLRACIMNAINKTSKISDLDIELKHIPYSLIIECICNLEYKIKWNNFNYSIDIYSGKFKIITIVGNVESGYTRIFSNESAGVLG